MTFAAPFSAKGEKDGTRMRNPETRTSDILHITAVEAADYGVLKLRWDDGCEGVVDLRDFIAAGEIFKHIRNPDNFKQVRLESYGHHVYWGEEGKEIVDLGCDGLREPAEEQAASADRTG